MEFKEFRIYNISLQLKGQKLMLFKNLPNHLKYKIATSDHDTEATAFCANPIRLGMLCLIFPLCMNFEGDIRG